MRADELELRRDDGDQHVLERDVGGRGSDRVGVGVEGGGGLLPAAGPFQRLRR
jgi:hypothetical protein